ncbi:hypothetical protein PF003_g33229 [Phytophthora fragariae]|nr:hypothetical protein PF003_g33229 [Phytophthora fragariae]
MHLNEADSSRLSLIAEEEAGNWRRRGKEEAWLKVRQLLIQEEAKATPLKNPCPRLTDNHPTRHVR